MDSSGCWDYHQSNCWGWQHTYRQTHTYILTMSPALVELISLPRRFLPHRALFPLPHPSAQPWAQPSCNYSLITHTLGGFTQTHTHTRTHPQTFMLSLTLLEDTFGVWIKEPYSRPSVNRNFCFFFAEWETSHSLDGSFFLSLCPPQSALSAKIMAVKASWLQRKQNLFLWQFYFQ